MEKELLKLYEERKQAIKDRLNSFRSLNENSCFQELLFCTLTPQSNAKRCWQAVEEIKSSGIKNQKQIAKILKTKARFHNNKSKYIIHNLKNWDKIKSQLNNKNRVELRNYLAQEIKGYGLKEASHFLRNIGKSDNKIAILDRHILRNLKLLGIIKNEKIKSKKEYLEIEQKFLDFSKLIKIPVDELDLLFWSMENGEIFK